MASYKLTDHTGSTYTLSTLEEVRERRFQLKDILNTNLLSPEARAAFERQYAETGRILEDAAKVAAGR